MDPVESGKLALRAYKEGYIVVFDQKDGMEVKTDDDFAEAPEAYEYCREELFNHYADEPLDDDPEGRSLRQIEEPADLLEGFQEFSIEYMFFRLSEKFDSASLEEVLAACKARCFFPPWYVFKQGKRIYSFG
ncbi:hypothetical protein [Halomonas lysinitropha]|uniref:Uncharacterized protein n=1 Tax=Halomonas lysinitropha TaxID=2607506 RepID=A0A5K1I4U0_9GAMM|nr:hypothetical protein [Halomonas lysinitropha]VVZ96496.1 hypothetical protein HALO32_02597 [Halomonas lysinitropha]